MELKSTEERSDSSKINLAQEEVVEDQDHAVQAADVVPIQSPDLALGLLVVLVQGHVVAQPANPEVAPDPGNPALPPNHAPGADLGVGIEQINFCSTIFCT